MIYGSAVEFRKYITSHGRECKKEWLDNVINAALLVASEWLDNKYEGIWIGYKTRGYNQIRSWPRSQASVQTYPYYTYKNDEIPRKVIEATFEAAYRHLTDKNVLQPDFKPSQYRSVSISGAISVDYNDTVTSWSDAQTEFPIIQSLMSDLLDEQKGGNLSPLSGKVSRL